MTDFQVLANPLGPRGNRVTLTAKGQVDFGTCVYRSAADEVTETTGATDIFLGVALPDEVTESTNGDTYYASGDAVVVALRGSGEIFYLDNTGNITQGTLLTAAANGVVATQGSPGTADYTIIGMALETATAGTRSKVLIF